MQLTRDLFAIAKFLFMYVSTFMTMKEKQNKNIVLAFSSQVSLNFCSTEFKINFAVSKPFIRHCEYGL